MQKAKDTKDKNNEERRLKMYTIKVELTDTVLGRNENDALLAYQEWLAVHMQQWKILEGPKYKGLAW